MTLELEDWTGRVIGAAIEVHRTLGPGFLERVYENALVVELARRGISFVRQLNVPIRYQRVEVGEHVLDLLVDDQIVVELKASRRLEDIHFVILRSYLQGRGAGARAVAELRRHVARDQACLLAYRGGLESSSSWVPGFPRSTSGLMSRRTGGLERVADLSLPHGIHVLNYIIR